jgi:hypothetical protein
MTQHAARPERGTAAFEDAQFEMVDPGDFSATRPRAESVPAAKPVRNTDDASHRRAAADVPSTGLGIFRDPPPARRHDDRIAFYGLGSLLVALSFWVSGGHALLSREAPAAVDGLLTSGIAAQAKGELADTAWRITGEGAARALIIEGVVRNGTQRGLHAGPVTVRVRGHDGMTRSFMLGRQGWTLGPGREVVVSGRLDIGDAGVASVEMTLTP